MTKTNTKPVRFYSMQNVYSEDFIYVFAMAVYLRLIEPSELTYLQNSGKTVDQIKDILKLRITKHRNNNGY